MAETVNTVEGIKYGFGLLVYLLGVGLAGGIIAIIGAIIAQGGGIVATLIGGLILLAGVLVIYAGGLGIAYKVVADGVKVGVEAAST